MIKKLALILSLAIVAATSRASAQRFMFTGVADAEVLAFFGKLQGAVSSGNRATVAAMVNYPLAVNDKAGRHTKIASSAELVKQYDVIFTPAIRQAITTEKPAKLTGAREGVAVAAGLVWISGVCDKSQKPQKCRLGLSSVNQM